ncbi:hypothetical protein [Streptomyces sp. NPDC088757]|uniref:hypothetical protein n=1 Tax=Streptomyces sp. NPDC088757 TaxID=3365889 RepID=UPI00380EF1CB
MDPHSPTAKHFPLIARFRPACLPLPDRVQALAQLAETAREHKDEGRASAVYNQAALIASDLGLPALARQMCHAHAAAHLHAGPLPAMSAIRGLEPVVNLARLQIRAGHADDGRRRLTDLYEAVGTGSAIRFEDITVPAGLTATSEDREEVRAWLWRVLLADGTRALTTLGRWDAALAHLTKYRGIGQRMLDGRQVAVIAALTAHDSQRAQSLLTTTAPGDPWEQTVTDCLTVLCHNAAGLPPDDRRSFLVKTYISQKPEPGMLLFSIRLGLAVLDSVGDSSPLACALVHELHRRTMEANDGYAAREVLAHPLFSRHVTDSEATECRLLLQDSSLGTGALSTTLLSVLTTATKISDDVIRSSRTS